MTAFERSGYTKDTKFKVLTNFKELKVGDIVTLYKDDGRDFPYFKTEDGRIAFMYLPNTRLDGNTEDLEVYEDPITQPNINPQVTQGSLLRGVNNNLNSIPKSYSINYSKTITINYEVKT